jgi:aminoglycoside 6'-N-acetyltransferase I
MAVIREVTACDVEPWAAMRARLWPEAPPDDLAREARAHAAGQSALIAAVWTAREADDRPPAGFIEISIRAFSDGCDSMPVPHVEGWYVEPFARGRGLGRELMLAAEHWSRLRGFHEIASDTEVHNEASQRAHRACGFQEVERLVKYCKVIP